MIDKINKININFNYKSKKNFIVSIFIFKKNNI